MARRLGLAAAVVALLVLAGWLAWIGEGAPVAPPRREVEFPAYLRPAEAQRARDRRLLDPPPAAASTPAPEPGRPPPPPSPRRDPFLVALPPGRGALVLEANALRHSRLGDLLVACAARESRDLFEELHRETGVDALKDVDRVAVAGEVLLASGFFANARLAEHAGAAEPYGTEATIYRDAGGGSPTVVARWRDQLLLFGPEGAVRGAIDQVEGRAPVPEPLIPEELTYGEAYGVFEGDALQALFAGQRSDLARLFHDVASRVEVHGDAREDVALTVRVSGRDPGPTDELARALAGALAAARVAANANGERELFELLELAKVRAGTGELQLELAVPVATLERWFAPCLAPPAEPGAAAARAGGR